ncbi:hypothetical protein Tco_0737792 [Tanacetum coccineum]
MPKPYKPKISYPQRLRKEKMEAQYGKFLDMIRAVRINVSLVNVLAGMPNYGTFLKELVIENMLVEVGKFTFPVDLVLLKKEEDSKVPIILGRLFLHTADAILEVDFDALLDEGSKILHSIEGTIIEEKLFVEFDEFMAMNIEEDTESETEEIPFEKITSNTDYKIKTSLEEPHLDLELKPLPDHLEYVFLEEPFFLLVIISSQLFEQNKKFDKEIKDKKAAENVAATHTYLGLKMMRQAMTVISTITFLEKLLWK